MGYRRSRFHCLFFRNEKSLKSHAYSQRPSWRYYYDDTDAIIYVVDSADRERIDLAADELHLMLREEQLLNSVLLVFANKQDLPGAMDEAEVSDALRLHSLRNRQWAIYRSSAIQGVGLTDGLDWLSNALSQ